MSVVRINAITVPAERAEEFERRFAARAGEVAHDGRLRGLRAAAPHDDRDVYLVYTRWASQEAFDAWVGGQAFQRGHKAHNTEGPVSSESALWSFDVIQREESSAPPRLTKVSGKTLHGGPAASGPAARPWSHDHDRHPGHRGHPPRGAREDLPLPAGAGRAPCAASTWRSRAGETVALLGPNGAGKTTTIDMMLGLLPAGLRHGLAVRLRPGRRRWPPAPSGRCSRPAS